MATKDDVIRAAEEYGQASFIEGIHEDECFPVELRKEKMDEACAALNWFVHVLDQFEQTIRQEVSNANQ
jgi:hypothetical protein